MKDKIESYFDLLWPINRSLTGSGNRETLKILGQLIDIRNYEIPSGTKCYDWTIPSEWNAKEAWIRDPNGNIVVDFKVNNLHLLGYSVPYHGKVSLAELRSHLYTLPEQPNVVPYITSYYKERWGFCLTHNQYLSLKEGIYEVFIDSKLDDSGSLTLADAVIVGKTEKEVLLSTYICHPSMASNELSGPLVSAFIYKTLKERESSLRYTYRFVFVPETIGSICYLSLHGKHLKNNTIAGFVVTTVGDAGPFTYKKSRIGNALVDRAVEAVLNATEPHHNIEAFFPFGSDERQYCSPGFNLPVGSLMRTRYGKYKEYHTSADNKSFISFPAMEKTVEKYLEVIDLIEGNFFWVSRSPFGEPQLGKRGLYPDLGTKEQRDASFEAMMWILNLSDGHHDTIEIVKRSGKAPKTILDSLKNLEDAGLIERSCTSVDFDQFHTI